MRREKREAGRRAAWKVKGESDMKGKEGKGGRRVGEESQGSTETRDKDREVDRKGRSQE